MPSSQQLTKDWQRSRCGSRLRHVCNGGLGALFLPLGRVDVYPPEHPAASPGVTIRTDGLAGVSDHPSNPDQLVLVSIVLAGEESVGARQWVSIAHLAHRDCGECAAVWVDRAQEYEVCAEAAAAHTAAVGADIDDRWSLFVRTSTTDDLAVVLVHVGDLPPSDPAEHP